MEQAGTLQPVWRVPVKQETSDTPTDTRHTAERQCEDPSGSHGLPEATGGWDRGPERTLPWSRRRERGPARILVWDLRPPTLRP